MKNNRTLTLSERYELENINKYFDSLVLERYPDTIVTRKMDADDCGGDYNELERLDAIYFPRLEEIIKECKDVELVARMRELEEVEFRDTSDISEELINAIMEMPDMELFSIATKDIKNQKN